MKKLTIVTILALLMIFSSCSNETNSKDNFEIISSNVTIVEDSPNVYTIILASEVSNSTKKPLHFIESNFDIVDENGTLIETMELVNAYPPVVKTGKIAVYYGAVVSNKISDTTTKLEAIPHIESKKSKLEGEALGIMGATTGASSFASGIVQNASSRTTYNNVHIAVISRKTDGEVVSVMTTTVDSVKPREEIPFEVRDLVGERDLGANEPSGYSLLAYIDPK